MSNDARKELEVITGMLKRFKQAHAEQLTAPARKQLNESRNLLLEIREKGFRSSKPPKRKPTEKELLECITKRSENF